MIIKVIKPKFFLGKDRWVVKLGIITIIDHKNLKTNVRVM